MYELTMWGLESSKRRVTEEHQMRKLPPAKNATPRYTRRSSRLRWALFHCPMPPARSPKAPQKPRTPFQKTGDENSWQDKGMKPTCRGQVNSQSVDCEFYRLRQSHYLNFMRQTTLPHSERNLQGRAHSFRQRTESQILSTRGRAQPECNALQS